VALRQLTIPATVRRNSFLIGIFVGVIFFITSGVVGWQAMERSAGLIQQKFYAELESTALRAASRVPAETHAKIRSASDQTGDHYAEISQRLKGVLDSDPRIAYIYTIINKDGEPYFIVDPTPTGDREGDGVDDKSYVMERYEHPDDALLRALRLGEAVATMRPETDKWGTFVSSYAPVFDAAGKLECIVGVDVRYEDFVATLKQSRQEYEGWFWLALIQAVVAGGVASYAALRLQAVIGKMILQQLELDETNEILAQKNETLHAQATTDRLTGLLSRTGFELRLDEMLSSCAPDEVVSLGLINLNRFARINEIYGHEEGDLVLQDVAKHLEALSMGGVVARLAADEFGVAYKDRQAGILLTKAFRGIQSYLAVGVELNDRHHELAACYGYVMTEDEELPDGIEMIRRANLALHRAEIAGVGSCLGYTSDMDDQIRHRALLESELRVAMSNQELWMAWQPIVDLRTGQVLGAEGLMRWTKPDGSSVSPGAFIPVAEQAGLIDRLGYFALEQACQTLADWKRSSSTKMLRLSVNVSLRQLEEDQFVHNVFAMLQRHHVDPSRLTLEITESLMMNDPMRISQKLQQLRLHGIRIALDDFGTGYSSLSMLVQLPLDVVKIDRAFVKMMEEDARALNLTKLITSLADSLGLFVVAEGVETPIQAERLRSLGCQSAQGFHYAPGLSKENLERFLADQQPSDAKAA